jgi:hypothetical protein
MHIYFSVVQMVRPEFNFDSLPKAFYLIKPLSGVLP